MRAERGCMFMKGPGCKDRLRVPVVVDEERHTERGVLEAMVTGP